MTRYRIESVEGPVPLAGDVASTPWSAANRLEIGTRPWSDGDDGPAAVARLLYDDECLYLHFLVDDDHIQAEERPINGDVWRDSCVELFASPRDDRPHYVNVEMNCLGQFLVGYGPNREDRRLIRPAVADGVRIETSVSGTSKAPSPSDDGWWLAAALPFDVVDAVVGEPVAPTPGDRWQGNAYCCRGDPEPRYVTWAPIDTPAPDFHRPEYFGRFSFG